MIALPQFVVRKSSTENTFMKIVDNSVTWTKKELANVYPSHYAAKRHIALFPEVPHTRVIVAVSMTY